MNKIALSALIALAALSGATWILRVVAETLQDAISANLAGRDAGAPSAPETPEGGAASNQIVAANQSKENQALIAPAAEATTGERTKAALPATLSYGLDEIVKLVQAGVKPEVIQTYIRNSRVAYFPNADDVVYLHGMGISSPILTELIRRGAELRAQAAQEAKEAQNRTVQPAAPPALAAGTYSAPSAPAPVVVSPPAETTYVYYYPDPVYGGACYPSYTSIYPGYSYYPHYRYLARRLIHYPHYSLRYRHRYLIPAYRYPAPRYFHPGPRLGFARFCRN